MLPVSEREEKKNPVIRPDGNEMPDRRTDRPGGSRPTAAMPPGGARYVRFLTLK
jgi:hypothetical protein